MTNIGEIIHFNPAMGHGFLYHTRTHFMPFATLKIRPNYLMCYKYPIKNNYKCIELSEL